MAGIRISVVINVGTATVGAVVGAGLSIFLRFFHSILLNVLMYQYVNGFYAECKYNAPEEEKKILIINFSL